MSEQDLAKPVVQWLTDQHWEVYQEVKFRQSGGIADIVAVRAGIMWIIECKTSLTFTVLEQASNWWVHFRSIAVPSSRGRSRIIYNIAKDYLKIGVIEVDKHNYIHEVAEPPLMREYHNRAKRYMGDLREEQKTYCQAGSASGGYYTPYRETMNEVRRYIHDHPGCTLKEIMDNLTHHHYASNAGARSGIRSALRDFESKWCKVDENEKGFRYYEVTP